MTAETTLTEVAAWLDGEALKDIWRFLDFRRADHDDFYHFAAKDAWRRAHAYRARAALVLEAVERQARLEAALIEARTQTFAVCEATEDECDDKLSALSEVAASGVQGAYYRARKIEAKAIRRAMAEVFYELIPQGSARLGGGTTNG